MPVSLRNDTQHVVDRQRRTDGAPPVARQGPVAEKRAFVTKPVKLHTWTVEQIDTLVSMACRQHTAAEIGKEIGRDTKSVANKARDLGIRLRRDKPGPRPKNGRGGWC